MDKSDREVVAVTDWSCLQGYLPEPWLTALVALPPAIGDSVQEIRLRLCQPVTLSLPTGCCRLGDFVCNRQQLEDCFLRFCQQAVYAHEWELSQGFLAVPGGIRVGVAGRAILESGRVRGVREVTSLCVRLPRSVTGCGAVLAGYVTAPGYPENTLVVGPPSSGKTTLLRDAAAHLASRYRVTVVDERGELSGLSGLAGCDVLVGYPKPTGVRQAVRCLAPEVVLFDELGTAEEVSSVADCAHAGVAVVATLHGRNPEELSCQPLVRSLLRRWVFARWVFLAGRESPGRILGCYSGEVKADGVRWTRTDCAGRSGSGLLVGAPPAPAGAVSAPGGATVAGDGTAGGFCSPTNDRDLAVFSGIR